MPLAPEYSWREDASNISLEIPLKGISAKNVDLYVTDSLIKLNFSPYILILDLAKEIDDTHVQAKAVNQKLIIDLRKKTSQMWGSLVSTLTKKELEQRRNQSIERRRVYDLKQESLRKEKKQAQEKLALRQQMSLDEANRNLLDNKKAEEKEREERALYESLRELAKSQAEAEAEENITTSTSTIPTPAGARATAKTGIKIKNKEQSQLKPVTVKESKPEILEIENGCFDIPSQSLEHVDEMMLSSDEEDYASDVNEEESKHEALDVAIILNQEEEEVVYIPAPRAPLIQKICFSQRIFPTPARESKLADEEDWMVKNRKHLKNHKGLNAKYAHDLSETEPIWIKAKADDFYRAKDYRSAVNAYSEAYEMDESMIACLSNRAACHLHMLNFESCVVDCGLVLSKLGQTLTTAPFENNNSSDDMKTNSTEKDQLSVKRTEFMKAQKLKLKILIRRGTAYCQLGKYSESKADYGVALMIDSQNTAVQQDYARISLLHQCHTRKEEADAYFTRSKFLEAISKYTEALEMDPNFISCASNRAACYLATGNPEACIQDCTKCLTQLQKQDHHHSVNGEDQKTFFVASILPPPGSLKRKQWVLKTLVRRGTAHLQLHQYAQAEVDYQDAVEIDPKNQTLQSDYENICAQNPVCSSAVP